MVLKGTKTFYDFGVSDQIAQNLKQHYMYGLLEMGAFTSIPHNSSLGTLQRTSSKEFEGIGGGWVWESGVSVVDGSISPYPVSGIYFNNTFYPVGSGVSSGAFSSSWYVDYRNGRVVFNSSTPNGSQVKCSYCARDIAVYLVDEPEWKTIINNYNENFSTMESLTPSGIAATLRKNRVWLPCMIIDVNDADVTGLQLGGGEIHNFGVQYHILSDKAFAARRLCDIILEQDNLDIDLYDINSAPFQLKHTGALNSGVIEYKSLGVRGGTYFWTYASLEETNGGLVGSENDIYRGEIRQVVKVARYNSTY